MKWSAWWELKTERPNVGKDVVQPELLSITDGSVKWYTHFRKKDWYENIYSSFIAHSPNVERVSMSIKMRMDKLWLLLSIKEELLLPATTWIRVYTE